MNVAFLVVRRARNVVITIVWSSSSSSSTEEKRVNDVVVGLDDCGRGHRSV